MENRPAENQSPLKIVFFGTPEFAVESLERIVEEGYHIVAVVTVPDKPAGRGRKIRESAVKKWASAHNLPLFQPGNLRDPGFIRQLKKLSPDVGVVVAFKKLPAEVYKIPRKGTFNLHASLLPGYRGAAPINWVIINGEKETGVTTFMLNDQIDTGDILLQEKIPIEEEETTGSLHDKLKTLGADLVIKTLNLFRQGQISPKKQPDVPFVHKAPKLNNENTRIDWGHTGKEIERLVRGLSPFPGAWTMYMYRSKPGKMHIYKGISRQENHKFAPGTVVMDGKRLGIAVRDGWFYPLEIKPESKRKMSAKDFINGIKSVGELKFF